MTQSVLSADDTSESAVFFDIDGGLRTRRSSHPHVVKQLRAQMPGLVYKGMAFDPVAIASLDHLCMTTGAKLVAATSWRDNPRLKTILKNAGLTAPFHPDWRTPNLSHEPSPSGGFDTRGREVDVWLVRNPQVKRWAWLDDMPDFLPHQQDNFVHINEHIGISPDDIDSALEVLGHQPSRPRRVRFDDQLDAAKQTAFLAKHLLPKS